MRIELPEREVKLLTQGRGSVTVRLAPGGELFPWAPHKGGVVMGPPMEEVLLYDGTPMVSLPWSVNEYWVVDAVDEEGNSVQLTPEEYLSVVTSVESSSDRGESSSWDPLTPWESQTLPDETMTHEDWEGYDYNETY